jgi:hypothetical protein
MTLTLYKDHTIMVNKYYMSTILVFLDKYNYRGNLFQEFKCIVLFITKSSTAHRFKA